VLFEALLVEYKYGLSWLNISMGTHKQYLAYKYDMNNMKQCNAR